jgi:hypothetical protein
MLKGLGSSNPPLSANESGGCGNLRGTARNGFDRTIAIEPNNALRMELARGCPQAETVGVPISEVLITSPADFVLCSHVLYYIPQKDWSDILERFASWLGPDGAAVVLLANPAADVMALPREFFGRNFDLAPVVQEFKTRHDDWEVLMDTLNCGVVVEDLESACTLTRFFLSDYPDWGRRVTRRRIQEYVLSHFTDPRGYRLSCDQDVVLLRRR